MKPPDPENANAPAGDRGACDGVMVAAKLTTGVHFVKVRSLATQIYLPFLRLLSFLHILANAITGVLRP